VLDENDPAHAEVLNDIKTRFREETFTRESIARIIHSHPELVLLPYLLCARLHWKELTCADGVDPVVVCEFCDGALSFVGGYFEHDVITLFFRLCLSP
jgi:hypothetical protein